jgi:hypothetical protein
VGRVLNDNGGDGARAVAPMCLPRSETQGFGGVGT